jgi:hypothetical protein
MCKFAKRTRCEDTLLFAYRERCAQDPVEEDHLGLAGTPPQGAAGTNPATAGLLRGTARTGRKATEDAEAAVAARPEQ